MTTIDMMIIVAGIILLILFILLKSTKVPTQVYKSKSIYSDHKERPVEALFSSKYGLVGKPDFILHTKDGLLPLEIKHSNKPIQPYFSHVMQLISYCLLMEEIRGHINSSQCPKPTTRRICKKCRDKLSEEQIL